MNPYESFIGTTAYKLNTTTYTLFCKLITVVSQVVSTYHYYKNVDLFRLGNPCCPGFPTGNASPDKRGCPFVPGLATGTKEDLLSRLVTPTGTKCLFFFMFFFSQFFFYFNYTFAFQLNLCIGIQCV